MGSTHSRAPHQNEQGFVGYAPLFNNVLYSILFTPFFHRYWFQINILYPKLSQHLFLDYLTLTKYPALSFLYLFFFFIFLSLFSLPFLINPVLKSIVGASKALSTLVGGWEARGQKGIYMDSESHEEDRNWAVWDGIQKGTCPEWVSDCEEVAHGD